MKELYDYVLSRPITSKKTLRDLLIYDDYDCWWFIDNIIYNNYNITEKSHPHRIRIYEKFYPYVVPIYEYLLSIFLRLISWVMRGFKSTKLLQSSVLIIFVEFLIQWRWISDTNGNTQFQNVYHKSTFDNIMNCDRIITPYNLGYFPSLAILKKYIQVLTMDDHSKVLPCCIREFWSWSSWVQKRDVTHHYVSVWHDIEDEDDWFDGFAHLLSIDRDKAKYIMKMSLLWVIPDALQTTAMVENIMHKYNPKVAIMTNEQTTYGRAWIYESTKHGIPTIGIQHGVISNHPAYFNHDSANVRVVGKKIDNSLPVPDITCVWGETEAKQLRQIAGYPENQVIVTGNTRYDVLSNAHNIYSKVEFMKKYNINPESKIILWATQCHGMPMSENHQYFKEVFEACRNISGVTLIIKQHPGEGAIYTQLINKYISQYNLSIPVIVPDKMVDTTELVYFSDVIINKYSTTGHEAVAFHKPMIIMDFTESPDLANYVKEGVGIPVYNPESLLQQIKDVLDGKSDLIEKQDIYIKNHMYKLDGKSADRIANIISNMILDSP